MNRGGDVGGESGQGKRGEGANKVEVVEVKMGVVQVQLWGKIEQGMIRGKGENI